jgi:putative oxidoreductase
MEKLTPKLYWAARIIASIILLQTLYFKFSASDESVYIFTTVGMEPWGRIAIGILELIAASLLLFNSTAWLGGIGGLGLMAGAIGMHVTLLGISVKGDGGYLFTLAVIVSVCCAFVLFNNKESLLKMLFTVARTVGIPLSKPTL